MNGSAPRLVLLDGEADFAGFRRHARALLASGVAPDDIAWQVRGSATPALLASAAMPPPIEDAEGVDSARLRVPPAFLAMCEQAALHDDARRFALLYRLLFRLVEDRRLADDTLDPDMTQARRWAQAVRRDMHKMTAFVRFRLLADAQGPLQLAWYEPAHHIVAATAPFFMRRFANERWGIFTPRGSVCWTPGAAQPELGPPAAREDVPPADAGEALWLTYYRHIFNPARLKLSMMQREMPRRYWPNLPEAALIGELAQEAGSRNTRMIESAPSEPRRPLRPLAALATLARGMAVPEARIDSLDGLREAVQRCRECPIGADATQAVCGEGPTGAALMFVGEQPGDQEDLHGRPFIGPAGALFDRALAELGIARAEVYIANAVKHFKFELRGHRRIHKTAAQREAAACLHWLEKEIELVQPRAIVALGATAARSLLGPGVTVGASRGRWLHRADGRPVCVTLHPSALLRADEGPGSAGFEQWLGDLRLALDPPSSGLPIAGA